MGSWGYYSYPIEPPGLSDDEWWRQEARFACEDDARPTHDEMIAMEDSGLLDAEIV